jgi:O-antigen/teichoic acid export membrane protein
MSTVAPALETTRADAPSTSPAILAYEPRADTRGQRFAFLRKNSFALADQVLISGTNFVTGVLTARALDQGEFGVFSVIYAGLLFANILQSTLVTQAHNVLGATRRGDDYRRYTSSTAAQQLVIAALLALIVLPLTIVAFARGWASASMLLAVIPAIVFWQLQEFVRRVLYTEQRYARAFANDLVAYGGQAILLIALFAAHKLYGTAFTGAIAFYTMAVACAIASVVGAIQLRHDIGRHVDWTHIRENWHFGKWLAGGELMGWCSSLHMQVWWAALLLGAAASADLRAAMILFGPARVVSFFLSSVLPTKFARALEAGGADALHAKLKFVYLGLVPTVGAYCLLLAIFPRQVLWLIYGARYVDDGSAVAVLVLYAVAAFLNYMQLVVAAALTASRQTQQIFLGSLLGCCVALAMSPLLIRQFGANGAILSMITTTLVVGVVFVRAYVRRVRHARVAAKERA